jgi:hypothetical protein
MDSKSKAVPVTGREGLQGCEMLRIQDFLENWLKMTVRFSELSVLRTLPPERILILISVRVKPTAIMWLRGFC